MPFRRSLLLAIPLAAALFATFVAPASARQLAVGAAAGYWEPPGYKAVPVYNWPNGGAWQPTDYSQGYAFREPIYWTPRGYKYVYVRGYYWKRLPRPYVERAYRRPIRVSTTHKVRRAPCVTDSGYGRYEMCRRFY
jgi:hypothetical protein